MQSKPILPETVTDPQNGSRGFVLAFTIILILGVTAISLGTMFNGKMGRMSAMNYKHKLQTYSASDGLMTLLAQEVINGNGYKYVDSTRYGLIWGKKYSGLPGSTVSSLTDALIALPGGGTPISSVYLGSQLNEDNYGILWTGWLVPPLSGAYTFFTRSDDASQFFLSTDGSPANLSGKPICFLNTMVKSWPKSGDGNAVSKQIPLIGGNRYYFEYYHKQEGWFDVGQMGWDGPEFFSERPITGRYLSQYSSDPTWAGVFMVGDLPVHYQVLGTGQDQYRLFTEASKMKPGTTSDTSFRSSLSQAISLKGEPVVPPAKMILPVIYYDYKADKSNPEFNQDDYSWDIKPNMVEATLTNFTAKDANWFGLSKIGKPTRKPNNIRNYNCHLDHWFESINSTPWSEAYNYNLGAQDCISLDPPGGGAGTKRFNNVVYKDSLTFLLDKSQGPYTYVFSQMGNYDSGDPSTSFRGDSTEFFPLDKYGMDPIGASHNFSFCMELHTTFQYQSGLIFEFTGDDDVWVYINNEIRVDMGGLHGSESKFLNLDDLKSLVFGNTYTFDLFQCERHEIHSTSRIVTNIKMALPLGNPRVSWKRDYDNLN
ncbi:MAG: fibro-slime domain-containing protein [Fibrobacterota bacterium]|nr:fibro-slime domain-containing protein [Fibrobacterota bacterium]